MRWVVLFVAFSVVGCCKKTEVKRLDLDTMLRRYSENSISADQDWRGARFETEGRVVDTGRNVDGLSYVLLSPDGGIRMPSLRCFLESDKDPGAAKLRKGGKAKVTCTMQGKVAHVDANKCTVAMPD